MRFALPTTALVSTLAAIVLAVGYVGKFGVAVIHVAPVRAAGFWEFNPKLSSGRLVCYVTVGSTRPTGGSWIPPSMASGTQVRFQAEVRPLALDLRRAVWDFDNHALYAPGMSTRVIGAPLWFVELPLLIAPLLWLRRRRRQGPLAPGFAVLTPG